MSSRPYGKITRKSHKAQTLLPADLQININGRHTLEQLSLELSKAVGRLQEYGVFGVQRLRMRLGTLNEQGDVMLAYSEDGMPVQLIQIPDVPKEPPYRP